MTKKRTVKISFLVSGSVSQTVIITDPKITPAKLQKLLESGKAATTIQEDGVVVSVLTGRVIGNVEDVDNDCSYENFEVTKN
jgi:hypothetical protein